MNNQPLTFSLSDSLAWLHGKKKRDIYVIISADGSTVMQDPGLNRPWSSPNKKLAEHHAAITTKQGYPCRAVNMELAVRTVIAHPKNQPSGKS